MRRIFIIVLLSFAALRVQAEIIPIEDLASLWQGPTVPQGWKPTSYNLDGEFAIILNPDEDEPRALPYSISFNETQPRIMVHSSIEYGNEHNTLEFFLFPIERAHQVLLYGRYRILYSRINKKTGRKTPTHISEMGSLIFFKHDPENISEEEQAFYESAISELINKRESTPFERPESVSLETIQATTWKFGGFQLRDHLDHFLFEVNDYTLPEAVSFFGGDPISLKDVAIENLKFKFTNKPVVLNDVKTNKKIIEIEGLPNNLKEIVNAHYIYSGGSSFIFNLSFAGLPAQELSLILEFSDEALVLKLASEPVVPGLGDPERFQIRHALKLVPSQ